MKEPQLRRIADLVATAVVADPSTGPGRVALVEVADEVSELVAQYPAYGTLAASAERAAR
jgi:glycine hydroxymethyltransferase